MEATVEYPKGQMPLRYRLSFSEIAARFNLDDEAVEDWEPIPDECERSHYFYYEEREPIAYAALPHGRVNWMFDKKNFRPQQPILSQIRAPDVYPELTYLADGFERMKFYREWNFGRYTPPRLALTPDLPQDFLLEDASNLSLVLSQLLNRPAVKRELLERMQDFYREVKDIIVNISGGVAQIFFHEDGLQHPVPATRLSDGSLRYLCLLAVLCHPEPPPVICIEEPEIGLHPDIIPEVAKLLVEASSRSQIFVTTHSDTLVDALTDTPEAIVVCEKRDGATELQRLDRAELKHWLDKYRLGEIWSSGAIGGNRW